MAKKLKLTDLFAGAGTRKPIDHLDAWYNNMAHTLADAVDLLQRSPQAAENALPAHRLAENVIASMHTFDMGGVNADVAAIKKLGGFKKLMQSCHDKDVHVEMIRKGPHMHVGLDPTRPFRTSQVLLKFVEPPPGQHPVLTR